MALGLFISKDLVYSEHAVIRNSTDVNGNTIITIFGVDESGADPHDRYVTLTLNPTEATAYSSGGNSDPSVP